MKAEVIPTITFLTLYRGRTVDEAVVIATSIDPVLIQFVARHLLAEPLDPADAVLSAVVTCRRHALRLIIVEEPSTPKEKP